MGSRGVMTQEIRQLHQSMKEVKERFQMLDGTLRNTCSSFGGITRVTTGLLLIALAWTLYFAVHEGLHTGSAIAMPLPWVFYLPAIIRGLQHYRQTICNP